MIVDEQFEELKKSIVLASGRVEEILELSFQLLRNFNQEGFQSTLSIEREINRFHLDIDDLCYKYLALKSPKGRDLRFVIAWLRSNSDLERIGDQALNIAQTARIIHGKKMVLPTGLENMMTSVSGMLKDSLDAFLSLNIAKVKLVFEEENRVNEYNRENFNLFLSYMKQGTWEAETGLEWILVSKNLERIGDHTTNLVENVIFIDSGEDIRHPRENQKS